MKRTIRAFGQVVYLNKKNSKKTGEMLLAELERYVRGRGYVPVCLDGESWGEVIPSPQLLRETKPFRLGVKGYAVFRGKKKARTEKMIRFSKNSGNIITYP